MSFERQEDGCQERIGITSDFDVAPEWHYCALPLGHHDDHHATPLGNGRIIWWPTIDGSGGDGEGRP